MFSRLETAELWVMGSPTLVSIEFVAVVLVDALKLAS